ncbi:MAG: hypothetical protein EA379_01340 [Phycisphaerales bacterium]|nr:MAG: hypothetical protein EA379_01340 [Phycisphaerales bacterium]
MAVTMRLRRMNFDRRGLQRRADRGKLRGVGIAGAIVRNSARRSIGESPGTTSPGSIPLVQKRFLVRLIRSAVDRRTGTAVAGPTTNPRVAGAARFMRTLEMGGELPETITFRNRRGGGRRRRTVTVPRRVRRIAARPYMQPAVRRERRNITRAFQGVIR